MLRHWVVVADEARARVLEGDELFDGLVQIEERTHPEGRTPARDVKTDRPGRLAKGPGRRSAMEPDEDVESVEATRFAREICAVLRKGYLEGRFERLILVAPPRFLGRLRAELDHVVARCVVAEIAKEWMREPTAALPDALRKAIPPTAGMP